MRELLDLRSALNLCLLDEETATYLTARDRKRLAEETRRDDRASG